MDLTKYWGAPGTGKTTQLLKVIEEIGEEYDIETDVCFCTYSSYMAADFIQRLYSDVLNEPYTKKESVSRFRNYATIHGVCRRLIQDQGENYKVAGDSKKDGDGKSKGKTWQNLWCEEIGIDFTGDNNSEGAGDKFFRTKSWLTNTMEDDNNCKRFICEDPFDYEEYKYLKDSWGNYKKENNLIDFDDMLIKVYEGKVTPNVSVLIVDEFQDLSPLQYEIYNIWKEKMDYVYIAGDPNQSIYGFQGCDPQYFIKEDRGGGEITLPKTHRLGFDSWEYAKNLLGMYNLPIPKITADVGSDTVNKIEPSMLTSLIRPHINTFVLAHTNRMARGLGNMLKEDGIVFFGGNCGGWGDKMKSVYNSIYLITRGGEYDYVTSNQFKDFLEELRREYIKPGLKKKDIKGLDLPYKIDLSTALKYISPFFRFTLPFDFSCCKAGWKTENKHGEITRLSKDEVLNRALMKSSNTLVYGDGIWVGTIHSKKGSEAEDVFLYDQISWSCKFNNTDESTACLFFVGVSRHKKNLYIMVDSAVPHYAFKLPNV